MTHDPFCVDYRHCKDAGACVYCKCRDIRQIRADERAKVLAELRGPVVPDTGRRRHDPACPGYQWGRVHHADFTCKTCDAIDALRQHAERVKGGQQVQHGTGENP